MKKISTLALLASLGIGFNACDKDKDPEYKLIFKLKYSPTQARLNGLGQPASIPSGNAAQTPVMNKMSAHYIELTPNANTLVGSGAVLYHAPEVSTGGATAIDFSKAVLVADGGECFSIPLKDVAKGAYQYLRVSLAYQNYTVNLNVDTTISGNRLNQDFPCTIASFVGYNTYLSSHKVKEQSLTVNGNRAQGYWGAESNMNFTGGFTYNYLGSGQSPAGATTVVNPLASTSPIPAGSCLVTGGFANSGNVLNITGNETKDIVVEVSLSINNSFEWKDYNPNGKWEPLKGEDVVDMGIRGMIPTVLP